MANLEEILSRLPNTDADVKAGKPVSPGPGSKFTGPSWDEAGKLCELVLAGGIPAVVELTKLIRDPAGSEFQTFKPEYLLHILTTYAGASDRSGPKKLLLEAISSQVTEQSLTVYVRSFLIRELQWLGDASVVPALAKCLDNAELCQPATTALLAIRDGAAEALRKALPEAKGSCRLVILHGLAYLTDQQTAAAFRQSLTDADEAVRLTAAWALSAIADPADVPRMLKAADIAPSYEQTKITSACIQMAEKLAADRKTTEAAAIYKFLKEKRTGPKEQYLRDLADRTLAAP